MYHHPFEVRLAAAFATSAPPTTCHPACPELRRELRRAATFTTVPSPPSRDAALPRPTPPTNSIPPALLVLSFEGPLLSRPPFHLPTARPLLRRQPHLQNARQRTNASAARPPPPSPLRSLFPAPHLHRLTPLLLRAPPTTCHPDRSNGGFCCCVAEGSRHNRSTSPNLAIPSGAADFLFRAAFLLFATSLVKTPPRCLRYLCGPSVPSAFRFSLLRNLKQKTEY